MMKNLTALLLCLGFLTGCGNPPGDNAEENNPRIRKGLEQLQLKRWDSAIEHFEAALDEDAQLARADLELALIYQQQKKNYTRAIYHYEQYLEKQPNSEKKPFILGWIRQAKISLVAEVGQTSGSISEEIIRLKRENNLLRKQVEDVTAELDAQRSVPAQPVATSQTTTTAPPPTGPQPIQRIQTAAPAPETYKVLPGDTLSKIARTVYGDSTKWKEIYGANMDQMHSENDLKAGQVILIPTLGN